MTSDGGQKAMQSESIQGFRLSPQQRRLWRLLEEGDALAYRQSCVFRLEGEFAREVLAQAWTETVARHEILRTSFSLTPGMSLPVQVVSEDSRLELAPGPAEVCDRPRAWLSQLGEGEHELGLELPALHGDLRTLENVAEELLRVLARGGDEGNEPPLQFADIAEWQNHLLESEETADAVGRWREHWREREISAQLDWPLPFEEPGGGAFQPASAAVPLAPALLADLARLRRDWGVPAPLLFLACWQVLLWRSTGRADVLVGVLHHGRGYEELRAALGPFAHPLPVHVRLRPEMTVRDVLAAARDAFDDAAERQEHFSWEQIDGGAGPPRFFPACFEAEEAFPAREAAGLRLSRISREGCVDRFKLALALDEGEGEVRLALRYDRGRFRPEEVERLAERLEALLRSLAGRPDAALEDLDALGALERRRILGELSAAGCEPREEGCLHRRFEEQVARTPERLAVVSEGERLTYRELNERANRLAHHLRSLGVGMETQVVLCLDRSVEAVFSILGVLKAGGAWVPLDASHPPERLRLLLEDIGAPVIVTEWRLAGSLPLPAGARVVLLDEDSEALAAWPGTNPEGGALPRSLAYAIYTSGSTGRPKRVLIEHRSPLVLLEGLQVAVFDQHLRGRQAPLHVSLNAPLIFDASVQQLVLLTAGHTLHLVPEDARADGRALLRFLRHEELDLFDCTPSQLRILVEAGLLDGEGPLPGIFLVAGEAIDDNLWSVLGRAERFAFYNIYGPTECTVDATAHRVGPLGPPTIGRPLAGYEVYLLDFGLRPVPTGAPGEICIGGAGLARGYAGQPETTASRFVPHPFSDRPGVRLYRTGDLARHRPDGGLEFLGRVDHQVKVRGFRIELGEVEAALLAHPVVEETAVLARPDGDGQVRLVAYVRPRAGAALETGEIYRFLAQRLPGYMVPAAFVPLAAFPRLPNGKLDRRSLPEPEVVSSGGSEDYAPARNAVEEILSGVWAELLRLDRVGLNDHFFERGGHSLLATQLISRVRDLFRVEIKVRSLFESPTLGSFAASVAEAQRSGGALEAPPIQRSPRGGHLPLSYSQQRLWLYHQLEPASTAYNLPMAVRLQGVLAPSALAAAFGGIVRRHEVLRTTFAVSEDREPAQVIHGEAGFLLPFLDLSAAGPDAEMEARRLLTEDARHPFDLTRGPVLRALLLRLDTEDHVLSVTLHHIVSDAWSMDVLVRELVALYGAFRSGSPSLLPELPIQYVDYALWQRSWLQGQALEEQLAFWRQRLEGAPALIRLAADRPRPAIRTARGGQVAFELTADLSQRLRELSRAEGCTLFMTLLAAFLVLLHHSSGDEDIVVGSPVSYRNWREIEGLIGFFVNTLPFRGDLSGDPSFRELLARVRQTALEAFAHEHLPFDRLLAELRLKRSLSHGSLFQVGFTFQAVGAEPLEIPGLARGAFKVGLETTQFELNLTVIDTPALTGGLQYSRDLFDEVTVGALRDQLQHILERSVEAPERSLSELSSLLAENDRRRWTSLEESLQQASAQSFRNRKRQAVAAPTQG